MEARRGGGKIYLVFFAVFFLLVLMNFLGNAFVSLGGYSARTSAPALALIDFNDFSDVIKPSYISQGYGRTPFSFSYVARRHNGIDIVARHGIEVRSATQGKIFAVGDQDKFCYRRGYGKFVVVRNTDDGALLLYAHLSSIKVSQGDDVGAGDVLGRVGSTGYVTASHLHISVFDEKNFVMENNKSCGSNPKGNDINPIPYLESLGV